MVQWHHARRDVATISSPALKVRANQISQNIARTLQECWVRSGENYPMFERLVRGAEARMFDDIAEMERIVGDARDRQRQCHSAPSGQGRPGGYPQGNAGYPGQGRGNPRPAPGRGPPPGARFGQLGGSGAYRDEYVDRDAFDYDRRHHHAATVHGVMHCKGGIPLQKGASYRIDFGPMRGATAKLVEIEPMGRDETRILLVGRTRDGMFEEIFDERRNEYGKIVFPIHRV